MNTSLARRLTLLAFVASFALTASMPAQAQAAAASSPAVVERDGAGQTLQDLYQAALKEGGTAYRLRRR